jgi:hypothetical protein
MRLLNSGIASLLLVAAVRGKYAARSACALFRTRIRGTWRDPGKTKTQDTNAISATKVVRLTMGALVVAIAACGGDGNDGAGPIPQPQIALSLTSSGATVGAGGSLTFDVTVTGSNGFTGPATITVTGTPTGVTAGVSTPRVAGSTTTSTVNITVGAGLSSGTYPLVVMASGSGVASVTGSFVLIVTAAGGFTIAASAQAITLTQGSSSTNTITITRTGGFAGSVGLTATGMSSGLSAAFTPPNAPDASATLTVTASGIAVTGTATVTIVGSAAALPAQTIPIQVTVIPRQSSGAGSVIVDFSGCGTALRPIWFAYQDGAGAWTRVASSSDIYRFTVSEGAGGYAYTLRSAPGASAVAVKLMSRAELIGAPINACHAVSGNKRVSATVSAVETSQQATVNLGGSTVHVPASATVTIPNVPNGTFDLVAWRMNGVRGLNTPSDSRGVIIRDVNVPEGASAGVIDFGLAASEPSAYGDMDFTGANAGDVFTGDMSYYTGSRESCTKALLYTFSNTTPRIPVGVWGFPGAAQRSSDFYAVTAVATKGQSTRSVQQSFHTAGTVSFLHFGAPVSMPVVNDVPGSPYRRLHVAGTTPVEYSSTMAFSYGSAAADKSAAIQATVAWLGGNTASLSFPDFTAVAGWDNSWVPATATNVLWSFGGTGASFSGLPCVEGALLRTAFVSGEISPP